MESKPRRDLARRLRAAGIPLRAIASQVGVSHETVREWVDPVAVPDAEPERLLSVDEVAARFGVSATTITAWARTGQLPCVRILGGRRRYRESDVLRLLPDY